jgi:hypothetical protein
MHPFFRACAVNFSDFSTDFSFFAGYGGIHKKVLQSFL